MKTIYVNKDLFKEAMEYLNRDITFYDFISYSKNFLKQLLSNPTTADIDPYLKEHGLNRKEFISLLMGKGIIERETKLINVNDSDKLSISYKIPKRNFDRKMRRLFAELFEKNEINESQQYPQQQQQRQTLLAPNGKRSKLPENLWKLVRTPQFKQWFGDWENNPAQSSKVVDENGEPLVMIHNTKEIFDVFDVERGINKMAYFADAHGINYVGGFERGNVNMYVFLNLRKPCDDIENGAYAKEEGFDGILVRGEVDGKIGTYAAVYNSNQIKNINNVGTFNPQSMNINETDCGGAMQGGGSNPEAGQFITPIGKVQRRKIYITQEQSKLLKEMGTSDAGNYQYDVPLNFNNGNDPAFNHTNMIDGGIPKKKKTGVRRKK